MESQNQMQLEKQVTPYLTNSQTIEKIDRRSANYTPNVWEYDFIQSLSSNYIENQYERQVENLTREVKKMLMEAEEIPAKLELIDRIRKLGIESLLTKQIKEALDLIATSITGNTPIFQNNLYTTALCFKILRQHNYQVSQDVFSGFVDEKGRFVESKICMDIKGLIELYEASHLGMEGETILKEAKFFSSTILKRHRHEGDIYKHVNHTLEAPLQWRVLWFDVKWQINDYEKWWRDLGLIEKMSFIRDRVVEGFLITAGLAFEPHHSKLRKWLTKVIIMVALLDDIYDVYGLFQELHQFTHAISRWDIMEVEDLPEYMKICFQVLNDITDEIAHGLQTEKGWSQSHVQSHIRKAWAEYCQSLFVEAKWFNAAYTPSSHEYLANSWVSSCGPLLSVVSFFCASNHAETGSEMINFLEEYQDLIHNVSLIIRLCNDLGTSAAEQEKGDAASSIACLMREANTSEDEARNLIREMISKKWTKVNEVCNRMSPTSEVFVNVVVNMGRAAHNLYDNGDKFTVQDGESKKQILSLLVQPLQLD